MAAGVSRGGGVLRKSFEVAHALKRAFTRVTRHALVRALRAGM